MSGMIERPFNIEWLAIGNLLLKIGLDLKTALPSIGKSISLGIFEIWKLYFFNKNLYIKCFV